MSITRRGRGRFKKLVDTALPDYVPIDYMIRLRDEITCTSTNAGATSADAQRATGHVSHGVSVLKSYELHGMADAFPHAGGSAMKPQFLALALTLVARTVAAEPNGELMADLAPDLATADARALHAALQREHLDVQRVRSQQMQINDAEHDLMIAHVDRRISLANRDKAIRTGDPSAAGTWAPRYLHALRDETDALARVMRHRIARDLARADLERAAQAVRHADAQGHRDTRG